MRCTSRRLLYFTSSKFFDHLLLLSVPGRASAYLADRVNLVSDGGRRLLRSASDMLCLFHVGLHTAVSCCWSRVVQKSETTMFEVSHLLTTYRAGSSMKLVMRRKPPGPDMGIMGPDSPVQRNFTK